MKITKDLQYAGQPLAEGIDEGSLLRFPSGDECCDGLQKACEDSATFTIGPATRITSVDIGGNSYNHETGFLRTEISEFRLWLAEQVMKEEIDARIGVEFDGTDKVTVTHVGVKTLDKIKVGSSFTTTTRKCDLKTVTKYESSVIGDAGNANKVTVMVDNVETDLANAVTYDAADSAANDATAAQLKTDLEAVWGAGTVISSEPNDSCGCYNVVYELEAGSGNFMYNSITLETVRKFV